MTRKKEKENKKREWSDVNEDIKFVCHGGKVTCKYCNPPIAELIATSTTVMLQNKPWIVTGDKDGKINFGFTGACMHPSQQRPMSPPPPCKSVINLGKWADFSDTIIDNYNAVLVKSKILCTISGENLEIIDSGQVSVLSEIEPKMKRNPKITDVYWINEGKEKNYNVFPNYPVTLVIETNDFESGEVISLKARHSSKKLFKGGFNELTITASVNSDGIAIIKEFIVEYE